MLIMGWILPPLTAAASFLHLQACQDLRLRFSSSHRKVQTGLRLILISPPPKNSHYSDLVLLFFGANGLHLSSFAFIADYFSNLLDYKVGLFFTLLKDYIFHPFHLFFPSSH